VLKGENNISYLVSDFQKSITNLDKWTDSSLIVNLLPIQSNFQKNISLDSVWFETPVPVANQNNKLLIKLVNHGEQEAEGVKTTLTIDGVERPLGIKSIPAKGEIIDTANINIASSGLKKAKISIQDYPVQFDDQYFISFLLPEQIKILAINEVATNKYLRAMFNGVSFFKLDDQFLSQIQYQKFAEYDLIVLNDINTISSGLSNELNKYVRNGGKILVFPSATAEVNSYNAFFNTLGVSSIISKETRTNDVGNINNQEFIFNDVFEINNPNLKLPSVQMYYLYSTSSVQYKESIMSLRSNTGYMDKYIVESGQIYACAAPLDEKQNNLVLNAEIFVPMLYKMAIARNIADNLGHKIGQNKIVEIDNKKQLSTDQVLKVKGEIEFIPPQTNLGKKIKLEINNEIKQPGYYDIISGSEILKTLAFNYNRKESNLEVFTNKELTDLTSSNPKFAIFNKDQQEGLESLLKQKDSGIILWQYFLIAALVFLLFEILLIKYMK
jgi:hypothetical protein